VTRARIRFAIQKSAARAVHGCSPTAKFSARGALAKFFVEPKKAPRRRGTSVIDVARSSKARIWRSLYLSGFSQSSAHAVRAYLTVAT